MFKLVHCPLIVVLVSCVLGCDIGGDVPYNSIADLEDRGVPTDKFVKTSFAVRGDGVIEFKYYTYGRDKDHSLIEPAIEKARMLTAKLRKKYEIRLAFMDGTPDITFDGKPVGSGKVLRETVLDRIP